jgi:mannose-1-phosphate guanylyltransferase
MPNGAGSHARSRWALVLAGGEGVRLRSLTRRIAGDERPKQFCKIVGDATILEQTVTRAETVIPSDQILVSVVRAHERFYTPLLAGIAPRCLVIQPENRGSAPAILYALLRLLMMAPAGPVAIFPSDHHVSDDPVFMAHIGGAFDLVVSRPQLTIVLGIAPDTSDVEYGWIEPGEMIRGPSRWPLFKVRGFWEKPPRAVAETLRAGGSLWNSFVIVAYPSMLVSLIRRAIPRLFEAFATVGPRLGTPWEDESVRRLYSGLSSADFSKDVLTPRATNLSVLPVTGVVWNDLGEPRRVMATLARIGMSPAWAAMSA